MKRHAFVKKSRVPSLKHDDPGYVFGVNSWVSQNKGSLKCLNRVFCDKGGTMLSTSKI